MLMGLISFIIMKWIVYCPYCDDIMIIWPGDINAIDVAKNYPHSTLYSHSVFMRRKTKEHHKTEDEDKGNLLELFIIK